MIIEAMGFFGACYLLVEEIIKDVKDLERKSVLRLGFMIIAFILYAAVQLPH